MDSFQQGKGGSWTDSSAGCITGPFCDKQCWYWSSAFTKSLFYLSTSFSSSFQSAPSKSMGSKTKTTLRRTAEGCAFCFMHPCQRTAPWLSGMCLLPIPWQVYKPLALRVSTCQARGLCFVPIHLGLQLESSDLLKVHLGLWKWFRDLASKMKLGRSSCSSCLRRIPPTQGCFLKWRKCSICVSSAPGPTLHVAGTPPVSKGN